MKRRSMVLAAVAAAVIGVSAWGVSRSGGADAGQCQPVRRDLTLQVAVEGELIAGNTLRLGPPSLPSLWNFKLSFLAPEGTEVKPGDPVLRFDTSEIQQQLLQKTAERDSAEKELEKKRLDLDKEQRAKLFQRSEAEARLRRAELALAMPEGVEAPAVVKQSRIDRDLARLEVASIDAGLSHLEQRSTAEVDTLIRRRDQAAARVRELQTNIQAMTVAAPQPGTVIYVSERGSEKSKIGDTVWFMQKIIELPDLTSLRGDASVAEADAGRVVVDQPVSLRFDAFPDSIVRGTVANVRKTVQKKSRRAIEKVVRLEVALDDPDPQRMRPGMRFRGHIEIARFDDALVVPHEAVFYGPQGAEVRIRSLGSTRAVQPVFGAADETGIVVTSGLDEDAWLETREGKSSTRTGGNG